MNEEVDFLRVCGMKKGHLKKSQRNKIEVHSILSFLAGIVAGGLNSSKIRTVYSLGRKNRGMSGVRHFSSILRRTPFFSETNLNEESIPTFSESGSGMAHECVEEFDDFV